MYRPSMLSKASLIEGSSAASLEFQSVSFPLLSVRRIEIPSAVPTKLSSGINSTSTSLPLAVILYLP